jgi:hypothetical protein
VAKGTLFWDEMVQKYGKEKAVKLLKEFKARMK